MAFNLLIGQHLFVFCMCTVMQMCQDCCNISNQSIINCGLELCVKTLKRTRTAGPRRNGSASPFDTEIILDGLFS